MSKKAKGINPELENAISKMMKEVMADPTATITDKTVSYTHLTLPTIYSV